MFINLKANFLRFPYNGLFFTVLYKKSGQKHCQMFEKFFYGIPKLHKDTVFYHEDGIAKPIPATVYGSALVHIRFPQI